MKFRNELEEFLAESICDDWEDAVGFLHISDEIESRISDKLEKMSEEELIETFYRYPSGYESLDELIAEIEDRVRFKVTDPAMNCGAW